MSATKLRVHVNAALAAIVAVGWFELPLVLDVLAGLGGDRDRLFDGGGGAVRGPRPHEGCEMRPALN